MTVEPNADAKRDEERDGSPERQSIDELLRALLVGDRDVRVDPLSGQAMPDADGEPAPEDRP